MRMNIGTRRGNPGRDATSSAATSTDDLGRRDIKIGTLPFSLSHCHSAPAVPFSLSSAPQFLGY